MGPVVSQEEAVRLVGLLQSLLRELTVGWNDAAGELPLAQLRVCRVLSGGLQSISAISRELGVSLSAVTQIADRLERASLVRRLTENNDRRIRSLQLTARGEKLLRQHDDERIRRMAAALEHLAPQAREDVAAALEMLVRGSLAARSADGDGKDGGAELSTPEVLL